MGTNSNTICKPLCIQVVILGDKIKFWEDRWIGGEESLAEKFPRLYLVSLQQHHLIQQVGSHNDSGWEWNFT